SGRLPGPRIDQDVDDVREKIRTKHDQGDDHEDPLHQRVIELTQGVIEVEADPWVVEYDLDQDLAGDHQADGDGEVRDHWQQRVARRVPHDRSGGQTLGRGHQDEVLVHGR